MVQVVNENQFRNRSVQIEIVEMMNTRYIDREIWKEFYYWIYHSINPFITYLQNHLSC